MYDHTGCDHVMCPCETGIHGDSEMSYHVSNNFTLNMYDHTGCDHLTGYNKPGNLEGISYTGYRQSWQLKLESRVLPVKGDSGAMGRLYTRSKVVARLIFELDRFQIGRQNVGLQQPTEPLPESQLDRTRR